MSDKQLDISRRKLLAGLGTAGVAAAGAGLGTTAYLNDTESFDGNTMTAGTLDLKVDWQQAYYGPTETLVPVNAYPDHDNDGLQSLPDGSEYVLGSGETQGENDPIDVGCADLESGDLPGDVFSSPNRTDANGGPITDQGTLVALDDVKPGDWGEITFSLHLCDNPGYVWLKADNFEETPGVTTEPEEEFGDDNGELAENTYVELWYDADCDNVLDSSGEQGEELEVALVSDVSGSMGGAPLTALKSAATDFVDNLSGTDEGAAVSFASGSNLDQELTTTYADINDAIDDYTAGGQTNMGAGISTAHDELMNGTNATVGANKVMIVLSDGNPQNQTSATDAADDAKDDGVRIFTIALGSANVSFLESIATSPADAYTAPDPDDLEEVYDEIAQIVITGENLILGNGDGEHTSDVSLAEAMAIMENNDGMIPLDGTGDMGYGAGDTSPDRDCFPAQSMHCIGMRWWVPTEVGNEIQGDTVEFDLGFYAEQCRHNDGARPATAEATETPTPTPTPSPTQTPN